MSNQPISKNPRRIRKHDKAAWLEFLRQFCPGPRAWRGALVGMLGYATVMLLLFGTSLLTTYGVVVDALLGLLLGSLVVVLLAGLFWIITVLLRWIPGAHLRLGLAILIVLGLLLAIGGAFIAGPIAALLVLVLGSLMGAAVAVLAKRRQRSRLQRGLAITSLVVGMVATLYGAWWLAGDGFAHDPPVNAATLAHAPISLIDAANPSEPGPYDVLHLTYGSGTDRHRPEYGADVDMISTPVDGTPFLASWSGLRRRLRTSYWEFGPEALPRNGRVWYPDSETGITGEENGPYPLVLIVHGNHLMEDFSDAGYAYLGELFASRGYITVSVDENFLNISLARGLDLTNSTDARAWMLLEHLRLWREWNATPGHPFFDMVDLDRIALIGHSRGGEAAVVAATFNRYDYYPDDARVAFDYDFGIRAVAALAPVDGQYKPASLPTQLRDIHYLALHGANDGDVQTFSALAPYHRLTFTEGGDWFKAGLYIYGANHGQFNTDWGRYDLTGFYGRFLNVRTLMPGEEQRQIARVYLSAFLEATLDDDTPYRALFRDPRAGAEWLPDTVYLNQYADTDTLWISRYQEDVNPGSATIPGGTQRGENLLIWREQQVPLRMGTQHTNAVYLGWDAGQTSETPRYVISLPGDLAVEANDMLTFHLTEADEPLPDLETGRAVRHQPRGDDRLPLDLTVELVDAEGNAARLPLSHAAYLQPPIKAQRQKARFMDPGMRSEPVPQVFWLPLLDFVAAEPAFDPSRITEIRLVFDRSPAGVILLNNVGLWQGDQ